MPGSIDSASQTAVADHFPETKELLESIAASALKWACTSTNHRNAVTFAVTSNADAVEHDLHPKEASALSPRAEHRRRLRWTRGRVAAQIALERLEGAERSPLLRGEAGEPAWPNGVSGSITHCDPWSIAAVTQSFGSIFLGIDLENVDRIHELDIASIVCRPNERTWIYSGHNSRELLCRLFSAKEALYKSLFPSYRRYIDFTEVELSWCASESGFRAALPTSESYVQGVIPFVSSQHCNNFIFSCSLFVPRQPSV